MTSNLPLLKICVVHVPFGSMGVKCAKKFLRATHTGTPSALNYSTATVVHHGTNVPSNFACTSLRISSLRASIVALLSDLAPLVCHGYVVGCCCARRYIFQCNSSRIGCLSVFEFHNRFSFFNFFKIKDGTEILPYLHAVFIVLAFGIFSWLYYCIMLRNKSITKTLFPLISMTIFVLAFCR